jgi:hypothetical protein
MDRLNFAVDGTLVRDTDLTQFKTDNAIHKWIKRVGKAYTVATGDDKYSDNRLFMLDDLDDFLLAYREELRAATEARKLTMPDRNLDLVVVAEPGDRVETMNYDMGGKTAGEVRHLFHEFERGEQMTAYEFDAYATLGEDECDRLGIETLHDMFGADFAEAFYRCKNSLNAQSVIDDLEQQRSKIEREIAKQRKIVNRHLSQPK